MSRHRPSVRSTAQAVELADQDRQECATFQEAEQDILRLMQNLRALNLSTAVALLELTLAEVRDQAHARSRLALQ
jgi:hypothetical protein